MLSRPYQACCPEEFSMKKVYMKKKLITKNFKILNQLLVQLIIQKTLFLNHSE